MTTEHPALAALAGLRHFVQITSGEQTTRIRQGALRHHDSLKEALEALIAERDAWKLIAEGRAKLNTAYRLGTQRGADAGLKMIEKGEAMLAKLAAKGGA